MVVNGQQAVSFHQSEDERGNLTNNNRRAKLSLVLRQPREKPDTFYTQQRG